jgi:hypothetical protein
MVATWQALAARHFLAAFEPDAKHFLIVLRFGLHRGSVPSLV